MGLLAPLYIFGILAVGIPILLHLIRRTPQGRQLFSSLMFLTPSPPRLTKRSRLSNILLLLIRAAAITLLAIAFMRPFFHWNDNPDKQLSSGRRILFLIDTSASMRRPNLWNDAVAQATQQLKNYTPADEIGLYLFDRQIRPALTMSQWNEANPAQRKALFEAALKDASPTWSATRVGDALAAAADLASENNSAASDFKSVRDIILISDFQEGGKPEALQGHEWPKGVTLKEITPLAAKRPGNANIQWVEANRDQSATTAPGAPQAASPTSLAQADGTLRIRIANQSDSTSEQFTLAWHNSKGAVPDTVQQVYVAPGHSQIVKVSLPSDGTPADRLVLAGDDCDFDNTLYLVPPQTEILHLLYAGDDAATDVNALRYYLQSALFDTPLRKLDLVARVGTDPIKEADLANIRLAVVARPPSDAEIALLKKYQQGGGAILWVGKDVDTTKRAGAFLDLPLEVTEAGGDYSLLSRVDLTDPLFAPFSDARFSDFSKIHFWKHRQVKWDPSSPRALRTLAFFDSGDPFLMVERKQGGGGNTELDVGKARDEAFILLASGWQPTDSQLALSSKFLPLMEQLVRRKDALTVGTQYTIDDAIPLPAPGGSLTTPDGKTVQLASNKVFTATTQPGIYHFKLGVADTPFAVNLAPDEGRTTPFQPKELDQWGVHSVTDQTRVTAADQQRILLNNELENKQKTWRWLLLAVLGLLALETALAGRLSRSASTERAAT